MSAGRARGPLIGGCIEVMEWLKGTAVWPAPEAWDGAVLFFETSEEAPPATEVKRWLRAYGAQGILHRVAAVLLGRPGGAELPVEDHAKYDAALTSVVRDELGLDLPLVTGMDFGHRPARRATPFEARVIAALAACCHPTTVVWFSNAQREPRSEARCYRGRRRPCQGGRCR